MCSTHEQLNFDFWAFNARNHVKQMHWQTKSKLLIVYIMLLNPFTDASNSEKSTEKKTW